MPVTVKADIGPKPSVVIEFVGMEDKEYYATLLSEKRSTGPWSQGNPYYDYMGEEWVFEEFVNYEDVEGYYFLSFMPWKTSSFIAQKKSMQDIVRISRGQWRNTER